MKQLLLRLIYVDLEKRKVTNRFGVGCETKWKITGICGLGAPLKESLIRSPIKSMKK
jgi:hypothetical protein